MLTCGPKPVSEYLLAYIIKEKKDKEKAKKQQKESSKETTQPEPVVEVDPEVLKAQEAERIAQQLLEVSN